MPITLFCIIFVNFVIINLAPGDPVTVTEISPEGFATRKETNSVASGNNDRYLQFREYYGLTLPILFNTWPWTDISYVKRTLSQIISKKENPEDKEEIPFKKWTEIRTDFGDRSRYIMPLLLSIINDDRESLGMKSMAINFFIRGGTRQAILGPDLSPEEKAFNNKISVENNTLKTFTIDSSDTQEEANKKIVSLNQWYSANQNFYTFSPDTHEKIMIFFTNSRFFRYFGKILTLDFGTLRNDNNKTVISEVSSRFKYSLTLSLIPMIVTFFLCTGIGLIMAIKQNKWEDRLLNLVCLILYAIPVFVVAPFLIEKVALNGYFPFTNIPIPLFGFTSAEAKYNNMTSYQRLFDVIQHVFLPMIAILYGGLAAQARLSRTAILEVMHQDYVRTAKAKGLSNSVILFKHVGRNAAITIITSIAGSLGVILGGSLIVETLFEIDGFGKFFYDSIINRDYNVIMFSALAGSFITLVGYLVADIIYTILDPRVTLD